jgi:diguanylate cyclase (GGDEF)-like protein
MGGHFVQFYEDDIFLLTALADYIGAALAGGDKGIAIAIREHLDRLEHTLQARGLLDANAAATGGGEYIAIDADQLLTLFTHGDQAGEQRFRDTLSEVVLKATEGYEGKVFIFGEVVGLLCSGGRAKLHTAGGQEAALQIERYLNNLQRHYAFTVLCAYPLSAFPTPEDAALFHEVCNLHSDVVPAESYDPQAEAPALRRTVASLQQQAFSLAAAVQDRRQIAQALHEVNFDRLTGLPNRNVFQDRLEMDIRKAHRSGLSLALLFIDLDHFKEINDTMGHATGDLLLKQVGQRLLTYVRETDTVARLGGDEFTVTLGELHDVASVAEVAQKIRNDLARPFRLGNELAYISASIGITLYPRDASNAGELLRNADQAMYQSKDRGRNRFTYFTSSMQEIAQQRMALSNELRRAFEDRQLQVFYQPIVDMDSGRICKAEALLRWPHPERGPISPAEFIPIAEHTGLIVAIGNWVFHEALGQARRWRAYDEQLTVNVNVSPAQFYHVDNESCRHWLRECCGDGERADHPPAIGIEITEGLLLTSNSAVIKQLTAFQDAGIKIALDDFGTGYSSLSYLRKFNLDYLKIDKSFVYNLESDPANVALCEAIIVMAHKLGLKVIAEGVESPRQQQLLTDAHCDFGQGYLFGRPLPAAEFEHLLRDRVAA